MVVAINGIIATKISLQYIIFIATTNFVAKTYYYGVYCNSLQRLTFVAIKIYYNKMKVIATKNFVAINLFSCSEWILHGTKLNLDCTNTGTWTMILKLGEYSIPPLSCSMISIEE